MFIEKFIAGSFLKPYFDEDFKQQRIFKTNLSKDKTVTQHVTS